MLNITLTFHHATHTHTMTQVFIYYNSRIPLMVTLLITPSFKSLDNGDEMHALAYTATNNMLCRFYNSLKERVQTKQYLKQY